MYKLLGLDVDKYINIGQKRLLDTVAVLILMYDSYLS